jgi:hypothetical protein
MALAWTTIDLPWGGGLDGKRHPYLRELPKAQTLINMRFQQSGALSARGGVTNRGGPAQEPDAAWLWRGTIAQSADTTYLLDQAGGNWRSLGFTGPRAIEVAQRAILRTQEGASTVACGVVNGHALYAWTKSPGASVYVMVRNLETGVTVYGPTTVAGLGVTAPYAASLRACAHENDYVTVFASAGGASINGVTFSISANGAVSVGTAAAFAGTSADHYEVHTEPTNAQVFIATDNGSNVRLVRLTRSGLALAVESAATLTGATTLTTPLGVCLNSSAGLVFAFATSASGGGGDVECWHTTAGTSLPASIAKAWSETPSATDPNDFEFLRAASRADGSTLLLCEGTTDASPYDLTATPPGNIGPVAQPSGVWAIELDSAGDQTAGDTTWNVYLGSAPVEWSGAVHALLLAPDAEQLEAAQYISGWPYTGSADLYQWSRPWASRRVAYVVRYEPGSAPKRVAEMGHDVASFVTPTSPVVRGSSAAVPQTYVTSGTLIAPCACIELPSESGVTVGPFSNPAFRSLREYRLTYEKHVGVGEVGGVSILASGYLAGMDGDRLGEVMQMPPPTWVDVWQPQGDSAGNDLDAEWRVEVVACWEWRDAQGRLHRSAPSDVLPSYVAEVRAIAGKFVVTNTSARIAIPPFIDAEIKAGCLPKDIYLVVYTSPASRSVGTGALATPDDTFWASEPGYGVALEDLRDASYPWMTERIGPGGQLQLPQTTSLIRPLYTNGDILGNDPAPSPLHVATTRERVWLIDSENRDRAYFSKPLSSPEVSPEFSAALYLRMPTEAGELVALGVLDDLVVFFSESSIHALSTADAGPDSTGSGDWPPLRRFSREVGCINAASVVTTDVGLFFASAAGIYLLAPTGQLTWVGRDLGDSIDWAAIVSSTVVPERKEVVFATASSCYVFDYDHGQWTTTVYTGDDGPTTGDADIAEAVAYGGELVLVSTEGIAWEEDASSTERVIYQARTGWIHLAGLQGFKRVRRIGLLGRITFDPELPGIFESPPNLGTIAIRVYYDYDETDFDDYTIALLDVRTQLDPMRLRQYLARHKCEALSVRVTVSLTSSGQQAYQPRPELVGLALEVGTLKRLRPWGHSLGAPKVET